MHPAHKVLKTLPLPLRRRIHYLKAHRRWPNLDKPRSFNEKVNWRIINDRRDDIAWTCDKLSMKEFAERSTSGVKVPRTLWSGTDIQELRDFNFPDRWILKANHRSQCVYLGVGTPDLQELGDATRGWLENMQADVLGEWAYSQADPLIFLEEWIGDENAPSDYKFFVFAGRVEVIQVDENRFNGHQMRLYDRDWNSLGVAKGFWQESAVAPRPESLDRMIAVAESLGAKFDFMRIDLFDTPKGIYFGETTPYPGGGLSPFEPRSFDYELGQKWVLPSI
ncbi:ATP-grasp fold amidoligase family protein [Arthrobacter sp. 3Tela_A]|uniref:ATP-grasp fold amidoligase family protein n=1 Tax=Arthrobacter sp. 3Tela_A TaxID=3093743 RepID=UPI003BB4A98C